jgi:cyclic pyranopterin phosphate synthase
VHSLSLTPGIKDISLTTNGYLLEDLAGPLRIAGLTRVNISLDTLNEDRYSWITGPNGEGGPGGLKRVLNGIEEADRAGLVPVKINAVLMRGFNDDELGEFAALTRDRDFEVRFIEFMPMSPEGFWGPEKVVTAAEAKGTVGFITPVSKHFCIDCNRIRITADGKLRTCLFSDSETDLTGPMRAGATDDEILDIVRDSLNRKPEGHMMESGERRVCGRMMSHIGG